MVRIDDVDVTAVPTHRRDVGLVFQDEQLFTNMDVEANVAFGLRMHRLAPAPRHARVVELLALVGLHEFGSRAVTTLSGGEAKRVAVARSLAPRPRVLLLDEPPRARPRPPRPTRRRPGADHARRAPTAVLVTHDPDEAAAIADRVVSLQQLWTRESSSKRTSKQGLAHWRTVAASGESHRVTVGQ